MAAVVVTVGMCNCPKWRKEKKACFSNKLYLCPFHKKNNNNTNNNSKNKCIGERCC